MASTVDVNRVREYSEENKESFGQKLDLLTELIRSSKYTVFYTGAGVSTSSGIGDYRGPTGSWTMRRIKELKSNISQLNKDEKQELKKLEEEAARIEKKSEVKVTMMSAQPSPTHMAMSTLIRLGYAHYVVTTNLDGLFRKAGLQGHSQLCCLHGDVYVERCTACNYDFERNYHVRQSYLQVHDHKVGVCEKCGSAPPKNYTGKPGSKPMKGSCWGGCMVGTRDKNCGTKDTHINFGECLDEIDWDEADEHCKKADLCIVAGTSMSLRHITHFPFQAKKVVIINLQKTPDDKKADLRIWSKTDPVFQGVLQRLGLQIDPIPVWYPKDAVLKIPNWVSHSYVEEAKLLEKITKLREKEQAGHATKGFIAN